MQSYTFHSQALRRGSDAFTKAALAASVALFALAALTTAAHVTGNAIFPVEPSPVHPAELPIPAAEVPAGSGMSYNWSGYAAEGTFTGVSGSWHVPTVIPDAHIASDAAWVGIGGVNSSDLIQAGTQALVEDGRVTYRAWYELLPAPMIHVPLAVRPRDYVSVSIIEIRPNRWEIVISNNTTGKRFEKTVTYESSYSSAEWIEERPSLASGGLLPLADFGSLRFENAHALRDGTWINARDAGARPIDMLSRSGVLLAEPAPLAIDGTSFVVTHVDGDRVTRPVRAPIEHPVPPPQIVRILVPEIGAEGSHGSYQLWINGKLVEEEEW